MGKEQTLEVPLSLAQAIVDYIQNNPSGNMPVSVPMNILARLQQISQEQNDAPIPVVED